MFDPYNFNCTTFDLLCERQEQRAIHQHQLALLRQKIQVIDELIEIRKKILIAASVLPKDYQPEKRSN